MLNTEQAIVDRLASLRNSGLLVRALPNKPGEFGDIQGNGVITVAWASDDVKEPQSLGVYQQQCLMQWVLDIRVRNLRDASGGLVLRQAIYQLLIGFKPPGCGKMYARKFEFVERQEAIWRFEALFVAPTLLIENLAEENLPLLKEIFAQEEVNDVPIAEPYPLITEGTV